MASIIRIFFENIVEAIFCSLFVINNKKKANVKSKILYSILCVLIYLLLKRFLKFNILFQVLFMLSCYSISILIFKKESNILDLIMILCSYLFLILESLVVYMLLLPLTKFYAGYIAVLIISRIVLFLLYFIFRNKIYKLYEFLTKSWNRKSNKTKIRSLTARNICVLTMNLIFLIIYIWLSII